MLYVRTAIVTTLVLVVGLFAYLFFSYDLDHQTQLIQDSFLKGHYQEGLSQLQLIQDELPAGESSLYHSYFYRALGRLEESATWLQNGIDAEKESPSDSGNTLRELLYGQALTALMMEEYNTLGMATVQLTGRGGGSYYLQLQAFYRYEQGDYNAAKRYLTQKAETKILSQWMHKAFSEYFTPDKHTLSLARCELKSGRPIEARALLEGIKETVSDTQTNHWNFLLGMTYLLEGGTKPVELLSSYMHLARTYIDRVALRQDLFTKQRGELLSLLSKELQRAITEEVHEQLPVITRFAKQIGVIEELKELNNQLIQFFKGYLKEHGASQVLKFASVLATLEVDSVQQHFIAERLWDLAEATFAKKDTGQLLKLWDLMKKFSEDLEADRQAFQKQVVAAFYQLLPEDGKDLTRAQQMLLLWQDIGSDVESRKIFSSDLIGKVRAWMAEPSSRDKGRGALSIVAMIHPLNERTQIQQQISSMLFDLFLETNDQNDLKEAATLYNLVEQFASLNSSLSSEEAKQILISIANGADSDLELGTQLSRVLQSYPKDQQALVLMGNLAFENAKYLLANYLYSLVHHPEPLIKEKEAVARVLLGADQDGTALHYLKDLYGQQSILDASLEILAYDAAKDGQWSEALVFFDHCQQATPTIALGRFLALFEIGTQKQALSAYSKLDPDFQENPSISIRLAQLMEKKKGLEVAASYYNKTLAGFLLAAPAPSNLWSPLAKDVDLFISFEATKRILKQFPKQHETFSNTLERVGNPDSLNAQVLKGLLLESKGNYDGAEGIFYSLIEGTETVEEKARIVPFLADVYVAQYKWDLAAQLFDTSISQSSNARSLHQSYAKLLMKVHRWDLAAAQLAKVRTAGPLSLKERVWEFSLCSRLTKDLTTEPSLQEELLEANDLLGLLSLALAAPSDEQLAHTVKQEVAIHSQLTAEQAAIWLQVLVRQGKLEAAEDLIFERGEEALANAGFIQGLIDYVTAVPEDAFASSLLNRAYSLHHLAPSLESYLEMQGRRQNEIAKALIPQASNNTSIGQLVQGYTLLEQALNVDPTIDENAEERAKTWLLESKAVLESLKEVTPQVPQVFTLLGRVHYLLNEGPESAAAFLKAVQLDPSYTTTYQHFALLAQGTGQEDRAISILRKGLSWSPFHVGLWRDLSTLFLSQGNWPSAQNALEQIIALRPNDIQAILNLSQSLMQQNQYILAQQWIDKGIALGPQPEVRDAFESVELQIHNHEESDDAIGDEVEQANQYY